MIVKLTLFFFFHIIFILLLLLLLLLLLQWQEQQVFTIEIPGSFYDKHSVEPQLTMQAVKKAEVVVVVKAKSHSLLVPDTVMGEGK